MRNCVRVTPGASGESAFELSVTAGPSSNSGGGEFVAMIETILALLEGVKVS
ncbi:MAG: hypothetical protein JWR27_1156 [Aeromicrobium sp.]|jgi:hypothetical protein|nr:hypothetical protein [Aeromicrobium sp.]